MPMKNTFRQVLTTELEKALETAIPGASALESISLMPCNLKTGDYQTTIAMRLFRKYKEKLTNYDSIEKLTEELHKCFSTCKVFERVDYSPKGFISFVVAFECLKIFLASDYAEDPLKGVESDNKKECLVDYSSPNIAKEMHVGHLRSTIIGETLCRILEFYGHNVRRVNHLGDWGTQFGMLIEYIKRTYPDFENANLTISDLTSIYKASKKMFDADEEFKTKAKLNVSQLQSGKDETATKIWKLCCDLSRKEFQRVYDRLNVSLIERGESFYNDLIPVVIEEAEKKRLVTICDGAKCLFVEGDNNPMILQKSDKGYGYDSTDLAAIYHRLCIEKNTALFYVVDLGQESHFVKLFKAAKMLNWLTPEKTCVFIGFGLVQGVDNKKFKTRDGDVVRLISLLDEASNRSLAELEQRANKNTDQEGSIESIEKIDMQKKAQIIGTAAVRYYDLRQNRLSNYQFSYDKILDPRGDTAVYLLYAYARICSIAAKVEYNVSTLSYEENFFIETLEEKNLVLHLAKFYDVILSTLEDYCFNRISDYLYELASMFSIFYNKCKVIGSPQEKSRLLLIELIRKRCFTCFHLLGIQPLERL